MTLLALCHWRGWCCFYVYFFVRPACRRMKHVLPSAAKHQCSFRVVRNAWFSAFLLKFLCVLKKHDDHVLGWCNWCNLGSLFDEAPVVLSLCSCPLDSRVEKKGSPRLCDKTTRWQTRGASWWHCWWKVLVWRPTVSKEAFFEWSFCILAM